MFPLSLIRISSFLLLSVDTKGKDELNVLQKHWLNLQHSTFAFEQLYTFQNDFFGDICNINPDTLPFCAPNFLKIACNMKKLAVRGVMYVTLLGNSIALEVVDRDYQLSTLSPNDAVYAMEFTKATYKDMDIFKTWSYDSLVKINTNMENQHTSMRKHLQDRHFAMET